MDDLISRQDAGRIVWPAYMKVMEMDIPDSKRLIFLVDAISTTLATLPSAQPEQADEWISCEEELPPVYYDLLKNWSSEMVLLWEIESGYQIGHYNPVGVFEDGEGNGVGRPGENILAWRPLPDAYEEETDG